MKMLSVVIAGLFYVANTYACVVTTSPTDFARMEVLDISIDAISVNPVGKSGAQSAEIARKTLKQTAEVASRRVRTV